MSLPVGQFDKKEAKNFIGLKKGDSVKKDIEKLTKDENIRITLTGVSPEEAKELWKQNSNKNKGSTPIA